MASKEERQDEVNKQNNIIVGDHVRVRYGSHAGEIATVASITWHTNQYGSYARVRINFEGGETDERGMDSLEKVNDLTLTASTGQ